MKKRLRLGDTLLGRGILTAEQLAQALESQRETKKPLGEVILQLGFLLPSELHAALADQQEVEAWDLIACPPTDEALRLLSPEVCTNHLVLPVALRKDTLYLAMRNPGDIVAIDMVFSITHLKVVPVQPSDEALAYSLQKLAGSNVQLSSKVDRFLADALDQFDILNVKEQIDDDVDSTAVSEHETRPVIGLVNQIITNAIAAGASDIHLEPGESCGELRYRVDGRLRKERKIPAALVPVVAARIMIMCDMDISNRRIPQDGNMVVRSKNRTVDLRVNLLPTQYGSRIVMRLLDRGATLKRLDELGFNAANAQLFRELIGKPYGIVLVTGPTGSGKTTTLYSALNEIKSEETNIITCEDPIEYRIPGISQSQVNNKAGLTFASQLRAALRQDPDTILVGEIRDLETAETAVRAALTGHLVLSTLHSNDAASAIPRVHDMGVEPYLLSSSLIGVVAQRLLRKICLDCGIEKAPSLEESALIKRMGRRPPKKLWRAVGCKKCGMTGYMGRVAVHEVLPVPEEITRLIAARASAEEFRRAAAPFGYRSLQEDALDRVEVGLTTIQEAQRVVFFNTFRQQVEDAHIRLAS